MIYPDQTAQIGFLATRFSMELSVAWRISSADQWWFSLPEWTGKKSLQMMEEYGRSQFLQQFHLQISFYRSHGKQISVGFCRFICRSCFRHLFQCTEQCALTPGIWKASGFVRRQFWEGQWLSTTDHKHLKMDVYRRLWMFTYQQSWPLTSDKDR